MGARPTLSGTRLIVRLFSRPAEPAGLDKEGERERIRAISSGHGCVLDQRLGKSGADDRRLHRWRVTAGAGHPSWRRHHGREVSDAMLFMPGRRGIGHCSLDLEVLGLRSTIRSTRGTASNRGRVFPGTNRGPRRPRRSCTQGGWLRQRTIVVPPVRRRSS